MRSLRQELVLAGTPLLILCLQRLSSGDVGGIWSSASPHKSLWPLNWQDGAGLALAAVSLFIAAGGGLGGGALLVPINLIIFGFNASAAVALSNICIVGGSIANFVFNVHRRHPSGAKPLIDWDLIMVMEPSTILGALVGGYINKVTPSWLTTTLLAVLLTLLSWKLWMRGVTTFREETKDLVAQAAAPPEVPRREPPKRRYIRINSSASASEYIEHLSKSHDQRRAHLDALDADDVRQPLLDSSSAERLGGPAAGQADMEADRAANAVGSNGDASRIPHQPASLLELALAHEARQLPWEKVVALLMLMAAVIGSDSAKQLVPCGGWQYWGITLAIVPLTLAVSAVTARELVRRHSAKQAAHYERPDGEVEWTPRNVVVYPVICSLAGLVAGMFGVGGGIVKGPLMLEMGVLADIAAATSATMIMFTAGAASAVYIGFGQLQFDYAVPLFAVGLAVTFAGQAATHWLMERLQRRSIIIFCMAALLVTATIVMYLEAGLRVYNTVKAHALWDWGSIC